MTKLTIAFPHGGIIPASVMGTEEDVHVDASTPIEVPEGYGLHLISDRFAVAAEMPKPQEKKEGHKQAKKSAERGPSSQKPVVDKALAEQAAADLAAAEKAVADAREMLDVVGDDMVAKAAAEDELKAAEAALAELKA